MKFLIRAGRNLTLLAVSVIFVMCAKKEEARTEHEHEATATTTPAESNRGVASASFGDKMISINYGRPQLRGRDMLAQATDGMVWRMGMNEATEIKTDMDLQFGETVIPQGHYSLWMKKVSAGNWQLVFNKKTGIWGHDYPAADDFAAVPMTMTANPTSIESFTIEVVATGDASGEIKAMWGTTAMAAAFTIASGAAM